MPLPIAAIIGSSLGSALIGGLSSSSAARRQERAGQNAINEQRRQFDTTRADLAPFQHVGSQAINALGQTFGLPAYQPSDTVGGSPFARADFNAIAPVWGDIRQAARFDDINWSALGMPGGPGISPEAQEYLRANWGAIRPAANLADVNWHAGAGYIPSASAPAAGGTGAGGGPNFSSFFTSPGYEFRRNEGTRGINNAFAARGGALSGNALRALNEFNSNLASNEFGNWFNQMGSLAGIGQSATNTAAQVGQNYAGNVGNAMIGQGNARASGIMGTGNAINNALQGGISNWLLARNLEGA